MRINVYHHETPMMSERHEIVSKQAEGRTFYGVRFYTEPPIWDGPNDDDSSAITLWAQPDAGTSELRNIAAALVAHCDEIEGRT